MTTDKMTREEAVKVGSRVSHALERDADIVLGRIYDHHWSDGELRAFYTRPYDTTTYLLFYRDELGDALYAEYITALRASNSRLMQLRGAPKGETDVQ